MASNPNLPFFGRPSSRGYDGMKYTNFQPLHSNADVVIKLEGEIEEDQERIDSLEATMQTIMELYSLKKHDESLLDEIICEIESVMR